jgi:acetyl-CoA acetyltransferase
MGGQNPPRHAYTTGGMRVLRDALYGTAGLTPSDVDVAQLYDAFTPMVLFQLEGYGLCERGESGAFVESGAIDWPDGSVPINTAGGLLSEGYVHGLNLVVEAVRQMRAESMSQVRGARICLVGSAPLEAPTSAMLLSN